MARKQPDSKVEKLHERIGELVTERQELRANGGTARDLERNRRKIARSQQELSHALIDGHLPKGADEEQAA